MDSKSILGKFLLSIETSSHSTKFIQLDSIILGLKNKFVNYVCSISGQGNKQRQLGLEGEWLWDKWVKTNF
jgi:hypothetical protein